MLRFPMESDREAFVSLRQRSRPHLEPWDPIPPSGLNLYSEEAFERELETCNSEREQRWFIFSAANQMLVGRIALTNIERGVFLNGRLGYWVGAEFQGQGLMTEALKLVVEHCFAPEEHAGLGLHRLCANIMPINTRSRALLQRVSFRQVGLSEHYLQIQGSWQAHEHWALTVEQYTAAGSDAVAR